MSAFGVIIDWLSSFWGFIEKALLWILDGFILLLQFVVYTILDGLFLVVETALAAIDVSAIVFNYAASWSALPTQLVWLINAVGLPQCFAILGAAYIIRLTLNVIPATFTRV